MNGTHGGVLMGFISMWIGPMIMLIMSIALFWSPCSVCDMYHIFDCMCVTFIYVLLSVHKDVYVYIQTVNWIITIFDNKIWQNIKFHLSMKFATYTFWQWPLFISTCIIIFTIVFLSWLIYVYTINLSDHEPKYVLLITIHNNKKHPSSLYNVTAE